MNPILVFGWYSGDSKSGNLGDELFAFAFKKLFPDVSFRFTSQISSEILQDVDTVILGGGSFLDKDITISLEALALLKTKKIIYVGVGAETNISPMHTDLIKLAKLVAIRSPEALDKVKALNENAIVIPDLVYALQDEVVASPKIPKSVLVLPNIEVVPNYGDAHWKYSSFEYFKSEFSQFLDDLKLDGYQINFFTMCQNQTMSDTWAAASIIGMMKYRSTGFQLGFLPGDMTTISSELSKYQYIITQRYHGIVLAEMMRIPYISIHHHDKLKFASPMTGNSQSYYGVMKSQLLSAFYQLKLDPILPISMNSYEELTQRIINII